MSVHGQKAWMVFGSGSTGISHWSKRLTRWCQRMVLGVVCVHCLPLMMCLNHWIVTSWWNCTRNIKSERKLYQQCLINIELFNCQLSPFHYVTLTFSFVMWCLLLCIHGAWHVVNCCWICKELLFTIVELCNIIYNIWELKQWILCAICSWENVWSISGLCVHVWVHACMCEFWPVFQDPFTQRSCNLVVVWNFVTC